MAGLLTLDAIPVATYCGDTFLVEISDGSRQAPEWSMEFHFRGRGETPDGTEQFGVIDITSADSNVTSHLFSVAATTTATWVAGEYHGVGVAVDTAGAKQTWWRGQMEVRPQLSAQQEFDPRTWAEICLQNVRDVIKGRASSAVLSSSIAGQTLGRMTHKELRDMEGWLETLVQQEEAKYDAENGKPSRRNIGISFVAP